MNLPARQELQEIRLAGENLPPGQDVQVLAPEVLLYSAALQSVQFAAVLAPKVVLYLPALQSVQLCDAQGE